MTIEIHQPELESLIQQRMASGRFQSVEEALIEALKTAPQTVNRAMSSDFGSPTESQPRRTVSELFEHIRGLLTDEEADTLFRRDRSPSRPIDLG